MKIIKNGFVVKIEGKCLTPGDIIQLYNFGFSIKGVVDRYAKDNKVKKADTEKIVTGILYRNAMRK